MTDVRQCMVDTQQLTLATHWKYLTTLSLSISIHFKGHFPGKPGLTGFTEDKDDGNGAPGPRWGLPSPRPSVLSPLANSWLRDW